MGRRGREIGSGGRGIGGLGSIRSWGIRLLSGVHWSALEGHISNEAGIIGSGVSGGLETAIGESNGVGPGNIALKK
jgi:hypothetical protein